MDLALLWLVVYSCGFLLPSAPLYTNRLPERPLSAKADVQTVSPERAERPDRDPPLCRCIRGRLRRGSLAPPQHYYKDPADRERILSAAEKGGLPRQPPLG